MKTIIRGARVLTFDEAGTDLKRATVTIEDDIIVAVAAGEDPASPRSGDPPVRDIDGTGHLLMPGLVNAHFHSSANHLKGSFDSLPLEIFMLFETPADGAREDARAAYVSTLLGAVEMLRCGVTSVLDDAFFVPVPSVSGIDAIMQAYLDSGMRATLALDQPNVPEIAKLPFLEDLLPPDLLARARAPAAMDAAGLLECYRHLIGRWHGAAEGRLRAAVSCSAPQRVTVEYFRELDSLSRRYGLPFFVHVLETKVQRVLGEEKYGHSWVRYMEGLGLLSDRMNIIHAVWVDGEDMDLIAAAGAVVAHNPLSNLRLGSGVMPFRELMNRGIPLCLGTDEAITDDSINLWNVAKLAGLIHNLTGGDYAQWPKAAEILHCLIRGGARALRLPNPIGQVAVGHQADLILLDLDTLPFTPLNDLQRQLVYCEPGTSVRMTMVAGRVVYENGAVVGIDERALRAEARDLAAKRAATDASEADSAARWLPFYRDMYLKAASRDVGMQRWLGSAT
ncbi:MAG: amidohydrolase family protein [Pseudomonadota bacterium]|nr:amidohydrolase family protein [Pseudomonadota bacterium]